MKVSKTWWFMLVQSIYRLLDPNPSFVNLSRRMTRCHNSTITVISVLPIYRKDLQGRNTPYLIHGG